MDRESGDGRILLNDIGESPVKRGPSTEEVSGLRGVRNSIKHQLAKGLEKAANLLGSGHKGGSTISGSGHDGTPLVGDGDAYIDRGSGSNDLNTSVQYSGGDAPSESTLDKSIIAKVLPFCVRPDVDVSERAHPCI